MRYAAFLMRLALHYSRISVESDVWGSFVVLFNASSTAVVNSKYFEKDD